MSDNISDMTDAGLELEISGKKYKLSKLSIDDFAAFEMYLRSERVANFLRVSKEININDRSKMIDAIFSSKIDPSEFETISASRFFIWRSLQKNHPEIKLEEMGSVINMDNLTELQKIVDRISGSGNPKKGKAKKAK